VEGTTRLASVEGSEKRAMDSSLRNNNTKEEKKKNVRGDICQKSGYHVGPPSWQKKEKKKAQGAFPEGLRKNVGEKVANPKGEKGETIWPP